MTSYKETAGQLPYPAVSLTIHIIKFLLRQARDLPYFRPALKLNYQNLHSNTFSLIFHELYVPQSLRLNSGICQELPGLFFAVEHPDLTVIIKKELQRTVDRDPIHGTGSHDPSHWYTFSGDKSVISPSCQEIRC